MLSTGATLRSAIVRPPFVRLVRPTTVHQPVANYRTPNRQKNEKPIPLIKPTGMSPQEQVGTVLSTLEHGVIVSPRRFMSIVETPNLAPNILVDIMKILQIIRCKDGGLQSTILNSLSRSKLSNEDASQAWLAVQESGILLDSSRLHYMITAFRKCNMVDEVLSLANRGFEENILASEGLIPIANYLVESGHADQCFALVKHAHSLGLEKSINAMYNIINSISRSNVNAGIKLFFAMLDESIKPDYPTVSMTVFHVFTLLEGQERVETLRKLLPIIRSSGYDIRYLLWDIFAQYIDKKNVSGVNGLFKDWFGVLEQPLPEHSKVDYHLRKHANSKSDDWENSCKATIEAYNALREHNFPPDSSLYALVLTVYDRLQDLSQILAVLNDMLTRDCSTVQAYTLALSAMARSDNIELGRAVYQIAKTSQLFFTSAFYQSSLKLAIRANDLPWARSLFADMKKAFGDVPGAAYEVMIHVLMKHKKVDESIQLFDEFLASNSKDPPSAQTFILVLVGLSNKGNSEKINSYILEAKRLDVTFTSEQRKILKRVVPFSNPPPSPSPSLSSSSFPSSFPSISSSSSSISSSSPSTSSSNSISSKTPVAKEEEKTETPLFTHSTNNQTTTATTTPIVKQQPTITTTPNNNYQTNHVSYSDYAAQNTQNTQNTEYYGQEEEYYEEEGAYPAYNYNQEYYQNNNEYETNYNSSYHQQQQYNPQQQQYNQQQQYLDQQQQREQQYYNYSPSSSSNYVNPASYSQYNYNEQHYQPNTQQYNQQYEGYDYYQPQQQQYNDNQQPNYYQYNNNNNNNNQQNTDYINRISNVLYSGNHPPHM